MVNKSVWLDIIEAKNRLFWQSPKGYYLYTLLREGVGILKKEESFFVELMLPPRINNNPDYEKPSHKVKVCLLEFNYNTKEWDADEEVISITLGSSDYRYLKSIFAKAGDRFKIHYCRYGKFQNYKVGVSWKRVKRGE